MQIIVMGGAGDVGSRAVEDLASCEDVTRVTIADRNRPAAEAIAARLQARPATVDVRAVDANDHADLVDAIRRYDVAASALGPFHLFEPKLVRAAIEAGTDYASVCDDWNAAEYVLDECGDAARRAGCIVVTGLGSTPGMSNIAVRHFADELDRVRRVHVYCYQPLTAGGGEAVLRHMLFIMSGKVAVWRKRQRVLVPACSESKVVEFPRYGTFKTWNMGHAEPVTLHRFLHDLEEANFFMGYGRGAGWFVHPARLGLFNGRRRVEWAVRLIRALEGSRDGAAAPDWGAIRVEIWGEKDGRQEHRMLCGIGEMRNATGLCLSVGTRMLARRQLRTAEPGVYAPEGCYNPRAFLENLRSRGLQGYQDVGLTRPIE